MTSRGLVNFPGKSGGPLLEVPEMRGYMCYRETVMPMLNEKGIIDEEAERQTTKAWMELTSGLHEFWELKANESTKIPHFPAFILYEAPKPKPKESKRNQPGEKTGGCNEKKHLAAKARFKKQHGMGFGERLGILQREAAKKWKQNEEGDWEEIRGDNPEEVPEEPKEANKSKNETLEKEEENTVTLEQSSAISQPGLSSANKMPWKYEDFLCRGIEQLVHEINRSAIDSEVD